jgi:hypothetical protein
VDHDLLLLELGIRGDLLALREIVHHLIRIDQVVLQGIMQVDLDLKEDLVDLVDLEVRVLVHLQPICHPYLRNRPRRSIVRKKTL